MKILVLVVFLIGCASHNILLIHPKTGDIAKCSGSAIGAEAFTLNQTIEACVKNYSAIGFIEADKLTDEQKKSIVPSGKIINQSTAPQAPASGGQASGGMSFLCKQAISRRDQGAIFVHC